MPLKKTDFSIIGKKSQLQIAMALTSQIPDVDDYDNFPLPSSKQIAAEKERLEREAREAVEEKRKQEEQKRKEAEALQEATKPKKKSATKVEQVSPITSEVVRVSFETHVNMNCVNANITLIFFIAFSICKIWANAEDAAVTLQVSLENIQRLLKGEYDAELGDEVGGYRWRYADIDAVVTEKVTSGRDSKKGREAYLQFREKLYDPAEPHVYKNENRLRDYQVDGVNWLSSCYYKNHGCILADESEFWLEFITSAAELSVWIDVRIAYSS